MLPCVAASHWQNGRRDMGSAYYTGMRSAAWLLLAAGLLQAPMSMSDLMVKILYPTADAVFYIETRTPADAAGWADLQRQTRMLADAAKQLNAPRWARG